MEPIVNYTVYEQNKYLKYLSIVGALSGLFSDSAVPLLHYRATENIYCDVFKAENLSRADVSADAKIKGYGVGIKTFIEKNKKTTQKIAEFNKESIIFRDLENEELAYKISELRNKRLDFTKSAYDVEDLIYHCIVRNKKGFYLYEEKMNYVDLYSLTFQKDTHSSISFYDRYNEYIFNKSKSTLFKRFFTNKYFANIHVNVLANPIEILKTLEIPIEEPKILQTIVVPLYSWDNKEKRVFQKSGLNQWNAGGRKRHPDEVYIPYPKILRTEFDTFFPDRNTPFDVLLPNGKILNMKISQEDGKALMSNPNKALGQWLLRDVLKIPQGQLITYKMLLEIGIDCVIFEKIGDQYKLDFKAVGEFEKFMMKKDLL